MESHLMEIITDGKRAAEDVLEWLGTEGQFFMAVLEWKSYGLRSGLPSPFSRHCNLQGEKKKKNHQQVIKRLHLTYLKPWTSFDLAELDSSTYSWHGP